MAERRFAGLIEPIADRLMAAYDSVQTLERITLAEPGFSLADAYAVLGAIERRRRAQGWVAAGRKIGFSNVTIWPRYGVYEPIWAHMWQRTVHFARGDSAEISLRPFVQPRIEPEVVFKLKGVVPEDGDALAALSAVEWLAPGFEIVQSHFPEWTFSAPDCAAAFGLHGALIVGTPLAVNDTNRAALAEALPSFAVTLRRGGSVIDRGVGSNVLGSPALALCYLARVLAAHAEFPPLVSGEIVTTGTVTDAWPVAPGEEWSAQYGALGLGPLAVKFTASCRNPPA